MKRPTLFVTLGFPGSGKTYFARKFVKQFGHSDSIPSAYGLRKSERAHSNKIEHLNSDKIRSELFKKPKYTQKEHEAVFNEMDRRAAKFLSEGKSVIYDANLTKRKFRRDLQKLAKKHKARYLLLWFQVPINVAIGRILRRKKLKSEFLKKYHVPIDKWVVLRMRKATEPPSKFEPYIIIDGERPYKEQLAQIRKFL